MDYLTTHTSLSPIRRRFAPGFVNYKKGCTRLAAASDKVYQLLAHCRWFSPDTPASSTTKTGRHDIAEILLKVALKHQIKLLALSVPDEGYSRNMSCTLNLISTFLLPVFQLLFIKILRSSKYHFYSLVYTVCRSKEWVKFVICLVYFMIKYFEMNIQLQVNSKV